MSHRYLVLGEAVGHAFRDGIALKVHPEVYVLLVKLVDTPHGILLHTLL